MANFIGRKIRFTTEGGGKTYEGYVHLLDQQTGQISLLKVVNVDTSKKLNGLQTFFGADISSIQVLNEEVKKTEHVDDDRIVPERRERGPRLLHAKYIPGHLDKLKDFEPKNHLLKNVDVNNKKDSQASAATPNKSSDYDSSSDQETLDFEECVYLSKINQRFHDAMTHLKDQSEIGVSFSGVCIGRDGKLSLIQMATRTDVFVFDIVTLGHKCWDEGLKSLFESPNVSKVMHDCRFPSDMLHHQYGVSMVNIFDTQVAEVFVYRLYHNGGWPKWVNGLSCSLFDHLNLSHDMVNNLKVRENLKKEDQVVWMQRPLPINLLKISIKEVVHLLQLRHVLTEKMMGEYVAGVDVYLAQVREASKEDVKKYQNNPHKLPVAFENLSGLLSQRDSSRYNRHRYSRGISDDQDNKRDSYGFRENCRGFVGVDVRYSNSSIWHEGELRPRKGKATVTENVTTAKLEKSKSGDDTSKKSPPSLLERLRKAASSGENVNSVSDSGKDTSPNQNPCTSSSMADKQTNQNSQNNSSDSVKVQSVGQLIRSKIKYDYESDVELVPAGKMLSYGNLHKPKQKRLTEIDEMSNKLEDLNKIKYDDIEENRNLHSSSYTKFPNTQNESLNDGYTTAPTSPNQFNMSLNNSTSDNFRTAPSTPSSIMSSTSADQFEEGQRSMQELSPLKQNSSLQNNSRGYTPQGSKDSEHIRKFLSTIYKSPSLSSSDTASGSTSETNDRLKSTSIPTVYKSPSLSSSDTASGSTSETHKLKSTSIPTVYKSPSLSSTDTASGSTSETHKLKSTSIPTVYKSPSLSSSDTASGSISDTNDKLKSTFSQREQIQLLKDVLRKRGVKSDDSL